MMEFNKVDDRNFESSQSAESEEEKEERIAE